MFDPTQAHRLVIYGGTFDPPHHAHVTLPLQAANRIGAEGVLYLPAGQPPHKTGHPVSAGHHRLAMLELALADQPRCAINAWELSQPGPSYTAHTLAHLRDQLPRATDMRLLMGTDMALTFDDWKDPQTVESIAEPLVMIRPPMTSEAFLAELPADQRQRWATRVVPVDAIDIASTTLRERIRSDKIDADALHPDVLAYIQRHGLYRG